MLGHQKTSDTFVERVFEVFLFTVLKLADSVPRYSPAPAFAKRSMTRCHPSDLASR